ncbi:MAG: hypothetical protein ACW98I_14905 [Candidatus Hodarchaeales archaeon]|jgi:hypothetical protein
MQQEIHRDERKRQITGWTRVATKVVLVVSGISSLLLYVSLFAQLFRQYLSNRIKLD